MKFALVFLAAGALGFGACVANVPNQNLNSITASVTCAEVDTVTTTTATQRVDTFSTELRARIGSGAFLYDQTFGVAFSDPTVQNAITTAHNVLSGAGAVNFTGPTQLSTVQSQVSSTTNVVTTSSTPAGSIVTSQALVGPATLPLGNLGICQSYVWNNNVNVNPTLVGCSLSGTPFTIVGGGIDINTMIVSLVNVSQTATTTNTFLTTAVYELDGSLSGAPVGTPVTPAPPALLLAITGLLCAGLLLLWSRRSRRVPLP